MRLPSEANFTLFNRLSNLCKLPQTNFAAGAEQPRRPRRGVRSRSRSSSAPTFKLRRFFGHQLNDCYADWMLVEIGPWMCSSMSAFHSSVGRRLRVHVPFLHSSPGHTGKKEMGEDPHDVETLKAYILVSTKRRSLKSDFSSSLIKYPVKDSTYKVTK